MHVATDGIVLRSHKFEENRILTILSRELGLVTAYANYAARPRSALAATTELLCYSRFQLFKSRERYTVDKADSTRIFFGIRSNIESLALASYWAQLFQELSPQSEDSTHYINLLLGCLHFLEAQSRPPKQLTSIIELRLLTLAGFMPNLVACKRCGEFLAQGGMHFSLEGFLLCRDCLTPEEADSATLLPVSPGVLAAMRHITYAAPRRIYSFTLSSSGLEELAKATEQYMLYHLEKTLPTLEFYRTLAKEPPQ